MIAFVWWSMRLVDRSGTQHDPLGRLAAATYENGRLDLRMPDAIGNLFRTRDRSDRTYGSGGQLLEVRRDDGGVTNYEYDAEGYLARRVEKGAGADSDAGRIWTFAWTGSGRLKKVLRPDGQTVTFAYDAIARRTLKTIGAETTRFVWDGDVPLHEYTEGVDSGPLRLESDRGIRRRGSRGAPVTWLFDPERFSPAANSSELRATRLPPITLGPPPPCMTRGALGWSFTPDIYGTARDQSSDPTGCPFGWAGQYEDREAGLAYNRYRYYDPNGVFISPDPLGLSGGLRAYGHVPDPLV